MYAASNVKRVYISLFLCLCAAFLLAPSVAHANDYWSVLEKRWIPSNQVSNDVKEMLGHKVSRPSGSTLSSVPSAPAISKNATGGLSASTNQILKTMGQPSGFTATTNYSLDSAKTALKSCVRTPACAARALGAGAIIYEGIQAWKDVYDYVYDNGQVSENRVVDLTDTYPPDSGYLLYGRTSTNIPNIYPTVVQACQAIAAAQGQIFKGVSSKNNTCCDTEKTGGGSDYWCTTQNSNIECAPDAIKISGICVSNKRQTVPVSQSDLDQSIDDSYSPAVSDAPVVLLSGDPDTFTLGTPAPAELPSTTTTNTDSQGKTTTTVKNSVITYNILNNNSSSPSIESTITETTNTYDDTANLVGSMTSTTTNNPVASDPVTPPNAGASSDFELPVFCTWAKPLCDWLNWTQEPLEDDEPDLIDLISEFEPDESQYNSGIGSGSCPAPMSLNLGIINRVVEVSYQPFCDFLDMIRPLVIAGAWLLSAFMYVGVLRRG